MPRLSRLGGRTFPAVRVRAPGGRTRTCSYRYDPRSGGRPNAVTVPSEEPTTSVPARIAGAPVISLGVDPVHRASQVGAPQPAAGRAVTVPSVLPT